MDSIVHIAVRCGRTVKRLRLHPVCRLEVRPGIRDKLGVARMIDGLHADDGFHQPGSVVVDVFDQLGLRVCRPGDENRSGVGDRLGDRLQIVVICRRVPAPDRVCLVVNVPARMVRVHDQAFDVGRADMEYARLTVIDPDDRMIVVPAVNVFF
ncbi:MAG TPA: hypothetical protein VK281_06355 [Xanthobacteraceae bacterium]|nr:hypothetical protein [Xanthobacteraceae bacterium]